MGDRRQHRKNNAQHKLQQAAPKAGDGRERRIHSVCVYCGSNVGANASYVAAARTLGRLMAEQQIRLVYGGGSLGLMGELARSVLQHKGCVTGIIPGFLAEKERMLREADEMIVVEDMHDRKMQMFEKSDAFVALPGGIGTLEELVEQLTWAQLGRHKKPIVLLNIEGFWAPLLQLLQHMQAEAFIRAGMEVPFITVDGAEAILPAIRAAAAPPSAAAEAAVTEKF